MDQSSIFSMPDYSGEYTPLVISTPYASPQNAATMFQNGSLQPQAIDFTKLSIQDIKAPNGFSQTISVNNTETPITNAGVTVNLVQQCLVIVLATITFQIIGSATFYGTAEVFIAIDNANQPGEVFDTGGSSNEGAGNETTRSFFSLNTLSPGTHKINLQGLIDASIGTPNLKITNFRLTVIPLAS